MIELTYSKYLRLVAEADYASQEAWDTINAQTSDNMLYSHGSWETMTAVQIWTPFEVCRRTENDWLMVQGGSITVYADCVDAMIETCAWAYLI